MTIVRRNRHEAARLLVDWGLLSEINRRVLHPLGLTLVLNRGVDNDSYDIVGIDITDDPEGWTFSDGPDSEKITAFMQAGGGAENLAARMAALGYTEERLAPGSVSSTGMVYADADEETVKR